MTTTVPIKDIYAGVNSLVSQQMGKTYLQDDNIDWVDFGSDFSNLPTQQQNIITGGLVSLVTDQLVIHNEYRGHGIDIIRSRSEYAQSAGIVQKTRITLPDAESDNEVYNPTSGSSTSPFKAKAIASETEYFAKKLQYRYQWTNPERWLSGAFLSESGFNKFIAGVEGSIRNAITASIDINTLATIRASIALNLNDSPSPRAYNLLAEYNAGPNSGGTALTVANALSTPEFLRYAIHRMFTVFDYMKTFTTFYNEKSFPNFSSESNTHFILLSQFRRSMEQYLLSDAFHDDYLKLPLGDSVASWKALTSATRTQPNFTDSSSVKDKFNVSWEEDPVEVDQVGVIGTIFSKERVGIHNLSLTSTSQYDPVGLRTNYWTHVLGQTIVDPYENGVTFYIA